MENLAHLEFLASCLREEFVLRAKTGEPLGVLPSAFITKELADAIHHDVQLLRLSLQSQEIA